jgi:hypothetical protein
MTDPVRAGEAQPLDQLLKFAEKVHYEAVGANALFSVEHWKHNAGIDWPDVDDGSYEAFENCVHPDCKMVREGVERLRASSDAPERDTEAVNWKVSYHQACDDADAYKADAEKRIAKLEQNWRSCQHEIEYLRARLASPRASAAPAKEQP